VSELSSLLYPKLDHFWTENIPNEIYHSDKSHVSSSQLNNLRRSPKYFLENFLNRVQRKPSPQMELGSLIHHAILESEDFGKRKIIVPNFGDLRLKENKKIKEEFIAHLPIDAIKITIEQAEIISRCSNSILNNPTAIKLLKNGIFERSGYFSHLGINQRIRPDCYRPDIGVLIDLKTTSELTTEGFSKSIYQYGYDLQMAMYKKGCETIDDITIKACVYIVLETEPPYDMAIWTLDEGTLEYGLVRYETALDTLKECIESNNFYGIQKESHSTIAIPTWAFSKI
jgi:hypothetical protein